METIHGLAELEAIAGKEIGPTQATSLVGIRHRAGRGGWAGPGDGAVAGRQD
jgi:hypothetical protein